MAKSNIISNISRELLNPKVSLSMNGHTNGSEQTEPLQPLPTVFGSWMGNRITPSNLSELFCWWIVFIHTFFHRNHRFHRL